MPRKYKPRENARKYKKYDKDRILAALREYESSEKSLAEIEKEHNISKSVLYRHHTKVMKPHGGQPVLCREKEDYIVESLNICSQWGYLIVVQDIKRLIKGHLDKLGILATKFKNNTPGIDYIRGFLNRHKDKISFKIRQNIKRSNAALTSDIVKAYFDKLKTDLKGVELSNIVNYDETSLADDVAMRKVIDKRKGKYPEIDITHRKSSTSLMMAAAADGTLLPFYVVYESKDLYETWTKNGPKGCRFSFSVTGWFNSLTFENWMYTIIFPYFENKPGKKVLIGDNLSSHLTLDIIRECEERDIHFVFIPANSSHLTQPLDITFNSQMKTSWRDILLTWKELEDSTLVTVPKSTFPILLRELIDILGKNSQKRVITGFLEAGVIPTNEFKVLGKLANNTTRYEDDFTAEAENTLVTMLEKLPSGARGVDINRGRKILINPGESVATDQVDTKLTYTGMSDDENNEAVSNIPYSIFIGDDDSQVYVDENDSIPEYPNLETVEIEETVNSEDYSQICADENHSVDLETTEVEETVLYTPYSIFSDHNYPEIYVDFKESVHVPLGLTGTENSEPNTSAKKTTDITKDAKASTVITQKRKLSEFKTNLFKYKNIDTGMKIESKPKRTCKVKIENEEADEHSANNYILVKAKVTADDNCITKKLTTLKQYKKNIADKSELKTNAVTARKLQLKPTEETREKDVEHTSESSDNNILTLMENGVRIKDFDPKTVPEVAMDHYVVDSEVYVMIKYV